MPFRSPPSFLLLLLSGALMLAWASIGSPAAGQPGPATTFSFLRLEPSARASALAGSYAAVYDGDVNALFYNPALLSEEMHRAVSFSYLNHLGDVNAGFLAHARHVEGIGTFGAGLRFVGWGSTDGYDENGDPTEEFGASDAALTLSFARSDEPRLTYGASVHGLFSSVGSYGASALAADFGVAYDISEVQTTLGASVNNLGVVVSSLGSIRDTLPLDVRFSASKRLQYVPLMIAVTGYNLNRIGMEAGSGSALGDVMRHVTVGGEFQFSEAFNVRFGYNHRRHEDLKMKSRLDMAGFGAGFGIKVSSIRFDYAFNSWSSLGGLHQFTIRTVI